jgi:hypothetical protein
MIMRVPRELGRPCRLHRHCRLEIPAYQLQVDPRPTSEAVGDERGTKRWYRQAKETKCGEKVGKESERLVLPLSQGNHTEGTLGRKGDACL